VRAEAQLRNLCSELKTKEAAHKVVEEQLRTSERRLIDAQRLAQVGSWERYFEAGAIYWSDETFRIFGRPVGPPPDFQEFISYVHPVDREKIGSAQESGGLADGRGFPLHSAV
jgi:hypothetical protein